MKPIRTISAALLLATVAGRAQTSPPQDSVPASREAAAPALLNLEAAIRLALENNYSLSLAKDESASAAAARRGGGGSFLPSASADLTHSGPLPLEGESPTTSVGASANWVVFDGFRNINGYKRLKSQEKSALLGERLALENLLENVLVSYYDLVQQKQRLAAIDDLLDVSQERARLAQAKLEVGAGSKLDQLQSLADLNQDSSTYLNQTVSLEKAKVRFNQLLARDPGSPFDVADSIPLEPALPLDAWAEGLPENNASIAQAKAGITASEYAVDEARGQWLPSLSTGVSYASTPEALNSVQAGGRDGFAYSVRLSMPLFDRLATPTAVRRARINLRGDKTRLRQTEEQVAADFGQARIQYQAGLRQMRLEERNLQVARLQAEAAQERYKLGASSPLEFRDAQTRLLDAKVRLITARQSAKQAEAALQRLAGALVRAQGTDRPDPAGGK